LNDVNPYTSPTAGGNPKPTSAPGPARWLSVRGAIAVTCFGFAAIVVAGLVAFTRRQAALNVVDLWHLVRGVSFGGTIAIALVLMGWGIASGRTRIVIVGLVATVPFLGAVAIRHILGWFP
jgi:hypothetical protein